MAHIVIFSRLKKLIQSRAFFALTLVVFVCSAAWIAWSGRFPMAYDENTHFGIIRFYADRWLPFWHAAPAGSETVGAITRDPSYLYHFFVSFPYRILDNFAQTQFVQVLILRAISIAIFTAGIVVYRRVLLKAGASVTVVHVLLALFILLPGTPFLAAQINYDNALFLASGVAILLAMRVTERLKRDRRLDVVQFGLLLVVCCLASLIKYAFLPIFVALVLWLLYALWRYSRPKHIGRQVRFLWRDFGKLQLARRMGLVLLLSLSIFMFAERYGVNVVRYHTPTPECDQVIGAQACQSYGPWARNYRVRQELLAGAAAYPGGKDPVRYTAKHWLKTMAHQQVFALNGRSDYFKVGDPLPVPKFFVIVIGGVGLVLAAFRYRQLRKAYVLDMFVVVTLVYTGLLWLQNYMDYAHLGHPVAIQGRYIMPVLPLIFGIVGLAYVETLKRFSKSLVVFGGLCIVGLFLQGGGATTYIVHSDEYWYWKHNERVIRVNRTAQNIVRHWVIGSY